MDKPNKSLQDLLDLTDSESSTSNNGIFENSQPFVMELHDIKKDQAPKSDTPDLRIKKRRKKRAQPTAEKSNTSSSSTVSDSTPKVDAVKEEFYDATGSLHELPENQAKPTGAIVLAQAHSEHGPDLKTQGSTTERPSATKQPSTIQKPVAPPDS